MLEKLLKAEPLVNIEEPNTHLVQQISKFNKKETLLDTLTKREKKALKLPHIHNVHNVNLHSPLLLSDEDFDK